MMISMPSIVVPFMIKISIVKLKKFRRSVYFLALGDEFYSNNDWLIKINELFIEILIIEVSTVNFIRLWKKRLNQLQMNWPYVIVCFLSN
jgi:hypothetical protein